jgi:hypothetical protein
MIPVTKMFNRKCWVYCDNVRHHQSTDNFAKHAWAKIFTFLLHDYKVGYHYKMDKKRHSVILWGGGGGVADLMLLPCTES